MIRFAGQITKLMKRHVSFLLLNASLRAQREARSFTWTTVAHANVRTRQVLVEEKNSWENICDSLLYRHCLSISLSNTSLCEEWTCPVSSKNEGLAEKCAPATLRTWCHFSRLSHTKTAFQSKTLKFTLMACKLLFSFRENYIHFRQID